MGRRLLWLGAVWAMLAVGGSARATTFAETIAGATCIPYPNQVSTGVAYQHWLYGFSNWSYCHLVMSSDWPVQNLSYVLFSATATQTLTVRLCTHDYFLTVSCTPARTEQVGGGIVVDYLYPPSAGMTFAVGAYLQFNFQSGTVSTIDTITPVWTQ